MDANAWHRRLRPVCVADFTDLDARFHAASDLYARTEDGGFPGTPAARTYRSEVDACWAAAASRTASLIRILLTGVPA